jgi:hypothetical protein
MMDGPNVFLQGGPDLPESQRVRYVADTSERVKLFRGHRYEHFEPTPQTLLRSGHTLQVFVWCGCTHVAE